MKQKVLYIKTKNEEHSKKIFDILYSMGYGKSGYILDAKYIFVRKDKNVTYMTRMLDENEIRANDYIEIKEEDLNKLNEIWLIESL
jgi:hypothetical protein